MTELKQNFYTLLVMVALAAAAWTASGKEHSVQQQLHEEQSIANKSEVLLTAGR